MKPDCQKCSDTDCPNYEQVYQPMICYAFKAKNLDDAFGDIRKPDIITPFVETTSTPKTTYNFDKVDKPSHYVRNGVECIDLIKTMTKGMDGYEGYLVGNIIKYLFRADQKNGVEDCKKAKKYVEFLIKEKENK